MRPVQARAGFRADEGYLNGRQRRKGHLAQAEDVSNTATESTGAKSMRFVLFLSALDEPGRSARWRTIRTVAAVAQWQSSRLVSGRSSVRFRPAAPTCFTPPRGSGLPGT